MNCLFHLSFQFFNSRYFLFCNYSSGDGPILSLFQLVFQLYILDLLKIFTECATSCDFEIIFSVIRKWFTTDQAALQKKAFRILEHIYKRYTNSEFASFFSSYEDELSNILMQVTRISPLI